MSEISSPSAAKPQLFEVTSLNKWLLIAGVILAFGHAPLLVEHLCNMWLRPHYQFVVFLPVAISLLWWRAYQELKEDSRKANNETLSSASPVVWAPWFVVSVATLGFATYMRSPWLAMASFPITVLAALLLLFGKRGLRYLLPGWLMLFVAVPLPGSLDVRLISELRTVTTAWASSVLDHFGVLHRMNGNVIDIPEISLFVADACTGIHSLFVLIAAALFIGLWQRRTVIHMILLLSSTVGLVLVENISRVSIVTILCQTNPQYSEGWRHASLGFALFAISLLLILSLDSLILFLIPLRDFRGLWYSLLRKEPPKTTVSPRIWPLKTYLSRGLIPVYVVLLVLGTIQLTWVPSRALQLTQMMKQNPIEINELGAEALPAEIDGWKRTDYQVVKRVLEDPLGEHSQTWTYERNGHAVLLSMDYPYLRIHDLTICYQGIGWSVDKKKLQDEDTALPYVISDMSNSLRGHTFLAYSLHSQDGRCEVVLDERLSLTQLYQKRFEYDRPWFQIQLLANTSGPLPDNLRTEVQTLFLSLRRTLLEQCLVTP